MFHRTTSVVASALLLSGAAVALTPAAQAAPETFTGHVQVIAGDTIVGCVGPAQEDIAYTTTDASRAYAVSIASGPRQDIVLTDGSGRVVGANSRAGQGMVQGEPVAYTFLDAMTPVPAGSAPVNDAETAIWSIDRASRELSAEWVWPHGSSQPVASWRSTLAPYVGLTVDLAALQERFSEVQPATFRIGEECSGEVVRDVAQAITFTSTAPSPAYPTQTYTVAATGGESGNPVTFSSTTTGVCTIDGTTVTFRRNGTCSIEANQAAAAGFSAAPPVTQDITVDLIPTTVDVTLEPADTVTGQGTIVRAQLGAAIGDPGPGGGLVFIYVDGEEISGGVHFDENGRTDHRIDAGVGSHRVEAVWWPETNWQYDESRDEATWTVAAADTTTKIDVTASDLTATVAPVAPGAGTPAGDVTFRVDGKPVGTAALDHGVAKLAHAAPAGHVVSADYAGSTDYNASSASTSRANPVLSTRVTSSTKARGGWYRTPVTVSFACDAKGGDLTEACPKPVTVTKQGTSRVTRTIRTADGGVATATATVKLDRSAPTVSVKGVKAGRSYFDAPKPTCSAKDSLSGVKTCKVTTKRSGSKVVVTAKATDVAGNVRTKRVSYRNATFTIRGAKKVGGVYRVKHGETYTLVVKGARARYVYATPVPGKPHRGSVPFRKAGKNTWALGVTMSMTTSATRSWNLGYTQNGKLHVVKVKVVG